MILDRLGALLGRLIGRNFDEDTMTPVTDVWLVVGLGNPGPAYAGHRHNVGYLVDDVLAERMGSPFRAHKSGRADVVEGRLGPVGAETPRVVLARARSYMNESGGAVSTLAKFYKVPPERIIAVHDELDIPYGALRIKLGGGDNGHNGLRSMRSSLGHRRLLPRPRRHRPATRPSGPGRLRALQLLRHRAQGAGASTSSRPRTRSRASWPTGWRRPSSASTAEARALG